MHVLGISAWRPGAAACLVRDGRVVAATSEAALSRTRDDARFPARAVEAVLRSAGISTDEVAVVAVHGRPALAASELVEWLASAAPRGMPAWMRAGPAWLRGAVGAGARVRRELDGFRGDVVLADGAACHAASAFLPSPFRRAAVLAIGGAGAGDSTTVGVGDGRQVEVLREIRSPHSIELLSAAFAQYLGLAPDDDESPWAPIAPHGEPRHTQRIFDALVDLRDDGSFRLDTDRVGLGAGRAARLARVMGRPARRPDEPIDAFHRDVARSVRDVIEDVLVRLARHAMHRADSRRLCLSGGAALTPEAVGRIARESGCESLWVQPATHGTAGAVGAALGVWFARSVGDRRADDRHDAMQGGHLGPSYSESDIREALRDEGARATAVPWAELTDRVAGMLADGKTCGWFQGRSSVGPRAFGMRSILGDPRDPAIRDHLGRQMRAAEPFPPISGAVAAESAADWFDLGGAGRSLNVASRVGVACPGELDPDGDAAADPGDAATRARSVRGLAGPDGTVRVRAVSRESDSLLHRLLTSFERRAGCPVLAHGTLRVPGEPVATSPADAIRCFRRTRLDFLVLGRYVVARRDVAEWKAAERTGVLARG